MREWQVGDPVGDGNDIGVPDIKYMGYLKKNNRNNQSKNSSTKNINLSKQYQDEAWKLKEENKPYDALSFINAAIRYDSDDSENWNIKGLILWDILETNDVSVGNEAYECFNKALEIAPHGKIVKQNKILFLIKWPIKLILSGDAKQAMIRINEALSIIEDKTSNDYAEALAIKGWVLMNIGNFDESMKYFDESLEVNPLDIYTRKLKLELIRRMAEYYDEDLFPWDVR